jgi:hypothetical protein
MRQRFLSTRLWLRGVAFDSFILWMNGNFAKGGHFSEVIIRF